MVCSEDTRIILVRAQCPYIQFAAARVIGTWFAVEVTNRREKEEVPSVYGSSEVELKC